MRVFLGFVTIFAFLFTLGFLLRTAHAQDAKPTEPPDEHVEAIARICVGEAGWESSDDCAAISYLLVRRAELLDISLMDMVRYYCATYFSRNSQGRSGWVSTLTLANAEEGGPIPRRWPRQLEWERFRPHWVATIETARKALQEEIPDPCAGLAEHWGARSLDRRELGWRRLSCGNTRNYFWSTPRRPRSPS